MESNSSSAANECDVTPPAEGVLDFDDDTLRGEENFQISSFPFVKIGVF